MLSTFDDPLQVITDSETLVERYNGVMPTISTRVKKWDEIMNEDAWADENFPWVTSNIEVFDSLE